MADDVRNEILAASRVRTGSRDLAGPGSRKFSQTKSSFDSLTSPTISPERPTSTSKPRSRQNSSSPPR